MSNLQFSGRGDRHQAGSWRRAGRRPSLLFYALSLYLLAASPVSWLLPHQCHSPIHSLPCPILLFCLPTFSLYLTHALIHPPSQMSGWTGGVAGMENRQALWTCAARDDGGGRRHGRLEEPAGKKKPVYVYLGKNCACHVRQEDEKLGREADGMGAL